MTRSLKEPDAEGGTRIQRFLLEHAEIGDELLRRVACDFSLEWTPGSRVFYHSGSAHWSAAVLIEAPGARNRASQRRAFAAGKGAVWERSGLQFVPSTPIALVAIVLLLVLGARRGAWVFFALLPFGAAAAFNLPALGGASIVVADLAAVAMFVLLLLTPGAGASLIGSVRPWQPGFFLTMVIVVAAFSAIFAPTLAASWALPLLSARRSGSREEAAA